MNVAYLPIFVRQYKKLPLALCDEIDEKISLFKEDPNHPFLKTHKLKGPLSGRWSFSVNYEYRIVFTHVSKTEVAFLSIGNHDIYR